MALRFESWQSIEFKIIREGVGPLILTHIQAVSYSDALEREIVHGAGRDPLGTTDPVYVPGDMSLEFLFKWWRTFIADVTNNGETRLGDHDLQMTLTHLLRGSTDEPLVDVIDFTIDGGEDSREKRTVNPLVTIVPCLLTRVLRNGVQL